MQGNDISNGSPARFLVAYDVLLHPTIRVEKRKFRKDIEVETHEVDDMILSGLWRFQDRMSCTLDLILFGPDIRGLEKTGETILEDLDIEAVNPFRSVDVYRSPAHLVKQMVYMPTVAGIIDKPEMAFVYGSKFYDLAKVLAL